MQPDTLRPLPDTVLDRAIDGLNLRARTLREELGAGATHVVFLRHFGCTFCRERVRDLRRAPGARDDLPPVLYVTLGSPDATRDFFAEFDTAARAVADPQKSLYAAFGLERGSGAQLLSPAVFAAGLRALRKGNGIGVPVGDVFQLSGEFVVRDGRIAWAHRAQHTGDHPDLDEVARAAAAT